MTDLERSLIIQALEEDAGRGDPTTAATIDPSLFGQAYFLAKAEGILAGIDIAGEVFSLFAAKSKREKDIRFEKKISDGKRVSQGDHLAVLNAPLDILLTAERVSLNLLQRMSGIATLTHEFVKAVKGTHACILDTRKTAPLLRPFDRYGVLCGGGKNHRYSLGEMILVKDNHIAANQLNIEHVLKKLRAYFQKGEKLIPVEIEVTSVEQLGIVLDHGKNLVGRVLFDNFEIEQLREAVTITGGIFETEASGGVNLTTVRAIAETGVDYISVGALTHSVIGLDISLEIDQSAV
ncbi:MAG: carboxylating nicotinate-nucleotide diphosphorylase [Candidatus Kapaibacterium sp.]